jgi:hypothetical protein
MNPKPWLQVPFSDDVFFGITKDDINGRLSVEVLNPLVVSTEVVSDSVEIIYEVAGEPGFSFGHPVDNRLIPITKGATVLPPAKLQFEPQIGTPVNVVDLVTRPLVSKHLAHEKISMGESIVSFRQIMKRFAFYRKVVNVEDLPASLAPMINAHQYAVDLAEINDELDVLNVDPFNFAYPPAQALATYDYGTDLLSAIGAIFAYTRGGVRLKVVPFTSGPNNSYEGRYMNAQLIYEGYQSSPDQPQVGGALALLDDHSANQIVYLPVEGSCEVSCPYYQKTAYHGVRIYPGYEDNYYMRFSLRRPSAGSNTVFLMWRAAADDLDFIFQIGVPDMMMKQYSGTDPSQNRF